MTTATRTYPVTGKRSAAMAEDEARSRDAQEITVGCVFCPKWSYTGPAGEARVVAAKHRTDKHSGAASRARKRRAEQRRAQAALKRTEPGPAQARSEAQRDEPPTSAPQASARGAGPSKPRGVESPSAVRRPRGTREPASGARRPSTASRARLRPLPGGGPNGAGERAARRLVTAARAVHGHVARLGLADPDLEQALDELAGTIIRLDQVTR